MDDPEAQTAQFGPCHLGQPGAQARAVIAAVDGDQAPGACFQEVESGFVDPVARVDDGVGEREPVEGSAGSALARLGRWVSEISSRRTDPQ